MKIQKTKIENKNLALQKPSFNSKGNLGAKAAELFVKVQEDLKTTRFIQCEITNLTPKAVFARSVADISEQTFLELTEAMLFFFAPAILGKFFKNAFLKLHPSELGKSLDENILKNTNELLKVKNSPIAKRALTTKAGIILACAAIPAGEYALSFAKNLFTLKVFKKSNFNNIANLNKEQIEDEIHQEKVEKSAYSHFKKAGLVSAVGLGTGLVFAKFGHKSTLLQKTSSLILQPGVHLVNGLKKIGLKDSKGKIAQFFAKYITPDFDVEKGTLSLSKGQLLVSTLTGLFGYSAAGKDRGRLDQLEVWTRVPIVVFYTVFGSSLFEHGFKHFLLNRKMFPELIKTEGEEIAPIPSLEKIKEIASDIAKKKGTLESVELEKLIKQKAYILGVPYAFTLIFMGFLLAGITRLWTQCRFNHQKTLEQNQDKT